MPEPLNQKEDLKTLVDYLRNVTDGVPIGVKLCAGQKLEKDIESCIQAEVDFISIDGGQAGTKGSPPILEDDFGLPTIYALSRTVQYLEKRKVKDNISLLIGGGFFSPGDCLKALALGADAVYMATAPLWAMTHTQVTKAVPFEPPTQLIYYSGTLTDKFNEEEATHYLENLRTYVTYKGKPGVYFIHLNSTHWTALQIARAWYRLNYFHAKIRFSNEGEFLVYDGILQNHTGISETYHIRFSPESMVYYPQKETLDYFLTERYCLYSVDSKYSYGL